MSTAAYLVYCPIHKKEYARGMGCPRCKIEFGGPAPTAVDMRIEMSQGPHGDEEQARCRDPWHSVPIGLNRHCPTCAQRPPRWAEKPALRPKTSAERKAEPIYSGVLLYFPDALAAVARLSKAGNDKHNPGESLHWAREKSTDHMDCVIRHSLTPNEVDPENREADLVALVWRGLAELQLFEEKRLAAAGIKPYSGIVLSAVRYTEQCRHLLPKHDCSICTREALRATD